MVYFLQGEKTQLIKIGYTVSDRSLRKRISQLTTEGPDELRLLLLLDTDSIGPAEARGYQLEAQLHNKFRVDRHHGEWFRPSNKLLAYIAESQKRPDKPKQLRIEKVVPLVVNDKAAGKLISSLNLNQEKL